MSHNLHINYVVMCDDIRTEDSGKHFLIGVYGTQMLVPRGQQNVITPLAFYISFTMAPGTASLVQTWIETPMGARTSETDWGPVTIQTVGAHGQIIWKLVPWQGAGLGTYKLHLVRDGRDEVVFDYEVGVAP